MSPGLELLFRIRSAGAAGNGVEPDDTKVLAAAIDSSLTGASLEAALGLFGDWRSMFRAALRRSLGLGGFAAGEITPAARDIYQRLERYVSTRQFHADIISQTKPTGARGRLYEFMLSEEGRLPSLRTLQRRLSP